MITNRNNTLKLRKHSIRSLTLAELNVVNGGRPTKCAETMVVPGRGQGWPQ